MLQKYKKKSRNDIFFNKNLVEWGKNRTFAPTFDEKRSLKFEI